MGQVAAMREIHTQDFVARLQKGEVHGHIRLRARVRLNIGIDRAEELLGAIAGQVLGQVDDLAAAVVAVARVALGVLIGQNRSLRF